MGMGFLLELKMFKIDCGDDAKLFEYTKTHEVVHFKWMNYMVHELYLNTGIIF